MLFRNQANLFMLMHDLNNHWTGEKISYFFPIPIPPLVVLWASAILSEMRTYEFKNAEEK